MGIVSCTHFVNFRYGVSPITDRIIRFGYDRHAVQLWSNRFEIKNFLSVDKSEFDQCLSDIQHIHKSLRLIHQIGMQHWRQRRKKIHYLETLYDKEIK